MNIQLTKGGENDEKVGRTKDGVDRVRNYTLVDLKKLRIDANLSQQIPTMVEVLDLLELAMKSALRQNIDLPAERVRGYPLHAFYWAFISVKTYGACLDLAESEKYGITDVFLNESEMCVLQGNSK